MLRNISWNFQEKGKKERFTILPDITIKYLRLYYKAYYFKQYFHKTNKTGYLFEGKQNAEHMDSGTIYFTKLKRKLKEFTCPACGYNSFSYKFWYYS